MRECEPCSICEEYIEGVKCNKDKCPVFIMKAENAKQLAEINLLKGYVNPVVSLINAHDIKVAKAEAIKEFAERLQDRCINQGGCIYASDIGAVLNEIVGDAE